MTEPRPELSRRIELKRLGTHEALHRVEASAAEREALARRFDLLSLERLEAEIRLKRVVGGMVRLTGHFVAQVVQACVISLEPVASTLEQNFSLLYGPSEPGTAVMVDLETDDAEPFDGDAIDIGEAVAQHLALSLDPYPRAPGATLDWEGDSADPSGKSGMPD